MKKQTALDWLHNQLEDYGSAVQLELDWGTLEDLVEQAKQMEKEQIQKDYGVGYLDYNRETHHSPEEYYNETYGGKP